MEPSSCNPPAASSCTSTYQFNSRDGSLLIDVSVHPSSSETSKYEAPNLIFVIDKSGSMRNSLGQVVQAVQYMLSQNSSHLPHFIVYDDKAYEVSAQAFTNNPPVSGGSTCFEAAFKVLKRAIQKEGRFHAGSSLHIVFMTDGKDNRSVHLPEAMQTFQKKAVERRLQTCFHTIGFRPNHDYALLEQIRSLGDLPGNYRYAGDLELEDRFAELFDFLEDRTSIKLTLGDQIIQATALPAVTESTKPENKEAVVRLTAFVNASDYNKAQCNLALPLEVEVFGQVVLLEQQQPDAFFALQCIDAAAIQCEDDLAQAQRSLTQIECLKVPKVDRARAMELRAGIQEKLNKYYRVFADLARTNSTVDAKSLTHQLNSLRFEANFRKTRRRRAMDKRILANAGQDECIARALEGLKPDLAQFDNLDLVCPLSGDTIREVMELSKSDFMVFPLKVGRAEHVIDAPTSIEVSQFLSGTYSFEAFRHTAKFTLDRHGAESTHGGFTGAVPGEEAGLFKGPDGSYMNAALPLYVNDDHFTRVRPQIRPLLGYFFTLDPLGYKGDQLLALYTVLGHMHARRAAGGDFRGAWADWLVADFSRLCRALRGEAAAYLASGAYTGQARRDPVHEFVLAPRWRLKAQTPNLLTLVGWKLMVDGAGGGDGGGAPSVLFAPRSAPAPEEEGAAADGILVDPPSVLLGGAAQEHERRWRVAFVEELWRRAVHEHYKLPQHAAEVPEVLHRLLYGPRSDNEVGEDPEESILRPKIVANNSKTKVLEFEQFARLKWGLMGKKKAADLQRKIARDGPPTFEGPVLTVKEYELAVAGITGEPEVAAYEDYPAFFDALVAEELKKVESRLRYLRPLLGDAIEGRGLGGEGRRAVLVQALRHRNRSTCAADEGGGGAGEEDEGSGGGGGGAPYQDTYTFLWGERAAEAAEEGGGGGGGGARGLYAAAAAAFARRRREKTEAQVREANATVAAKRVLLARGAEEFCGRLMAACPTRGGPVFDRVAAMLAAGAVGPGGGGGGGGGIPLLAEKVAVVLTGRCRLGGGQEEDFPALAEGTAWVHCPAALALALRERVGEAAFLAIELRMRGTVGWVYRPSDIPNRHGHCNSNPNPDLVKTFKGFDFTVTNQTSMTNI